MAFLQRQRNFWNEMIWKPKRPLSLDQLKYHYQVIERNPLVTENNKKLIVETFRSIAEILIWGDQNDSSVFDFFLEKNMQSYFLRILNQKCGRYVVLQLLQTLSILFENIRNETSIYYLLSNNHVNSIIVLKLDFSDEEVLAYYISFLKTLSFKLNKHTIHFFYNEHLRDFPLYTEAIKFFNHPESMVRIAVRTLTLNVYKVDDKNMLEYIRNKTAAPYFSNLVWFIGNHILQLSECLSQASHLHRSRLESLVAEHLDHLHYIHDILSLNVSSLNEILVDHLLNRLFIPLYVNSMCEVSAAGSSCQDEESPRISSRVALFLLSQVFLILSTPMLINQLGFLILTGDQSLNLLPILTNESKGSPSSSSTGSPSKHRRSSSRGSIRGFIPPEEPLSIGLNIKSDHARPMRMQGWSGSQMDGGEIHGRNGTHEGSSTESQSHMKELSSIPECDGFVVIESPSERDKLMMESARREIEKAKQENKETKEMEDDEEEDPSPIATTPVHSLPIISTLFVDSILSAMIPQPNDDSCCLFAISIIYAIMTNKGIEPRLLEAFSLTKVKEGQETFYLHSELVGKLLSVLEASSVCSVRLVTVYMCLTVLSLLLEVPSALTDHHQKKLERAIGASCSQLGKFYKSLGSGDDMFLEMFEDEYAHERRFRLQVNHLLMDETLLLPPAESPMSGIDFTRRLPCGDTEKAQKAMRVFFAIREFTLNLNGEEETCLPLTPRLSSVITEDIVDTSSCDLVLCKVHVGESVTERFMVVSDSEFMLVNPDKTQMGCGVVKFIAFLQDVDVSTDPADNCTLFIVAHHRSKSQVKRRPALSARFVFEDHIRCLATRQSLQRRKEVLRHSKMVIIASMLGLPPPASPLRKRQESPPTALPLAEEHTSSLSPMSSSSPNVYHSLANQNLNSSGKAQTPLMDHYELETLDGTKDVPSLDRGPSPQVRYINNSDTVTLTFGGEVLNDKLENSPVRVLPPLKTGDTVGDESDEGKKELEEAKKVNEVESEESENERDEEENDDFISELQRDLEEKLLDGNEESTVRKSPSSPARKSPSSPARKSPLSPNARRSPSTSEDKTESTNLELASVPLVADTIHPLEISEAV